MSYLKFDKSELVNLEYSLPREILATNKRGGYMNTTIVGCNTRKYHGLFVLPLECYGNKRYILLSALDETLVQHGREFNLGIRNYGKNSYDPRGHKYIVDFEYDRTAVLTYRVGGMLFQKNFLFLPNRDQLLIRYTLLEAHSQTTLKLRPFLAYREIHSLTHANDRANTNFLNVENGVGFNMYTGFPNLYIQINRENEYVHDPHWYYGVNYPEEERRGFEHREDLLNPGTFELPVRKGDSVIVSISTSSVPVRGLTRVFDNNEVRKDGRDSYEDCLRHAAKQFIVHTKGNSLEIYSGYTWLEKSLRATLISLPGLTLFSDGDVETFDRILDSTCRLYERQLLEGSKDVEAALWLFWVIQQYADFTGKEKEAWLRFRELLTRIADSFLSGDRMGVNCAGNGLLWAKMYGVAMTWMNAYDNEGNPITERGGYQVEVNALWYNAVSYLVEMEKKYGGDPRFLYRWQDIREKIERNFLDLFWVKERRHLADYVNEAGQNTDTRPNQIFACALEYSPIPEEYRSLVMEAVRRELLTDRGIRTLSPKNPLYKGIYDGNQDQRDHAYHQGSTRVWLLPFYIEAFLRLYGNGCVRKASEKIAAFEEDMTVHGVGAVCELYDGDPPHYPHGAISSAVATAGLLRAFHLVGKQLKQES